MKIKCIIVDDEPLAIEVIQVHLEKIGGFEVVAKCQNAMDAFAALKSHKIDLMFLDIQMPGFKGNDFLRSLKDAPKTIFVTAYREFAIEGYELDVVDYLLKPVSFERFFKAITKYMDSISVKVASDAPSSGNKEEEFVYVRANKKIHKLYLKEILYVESVKDYITIHTKSQKLTSKQTITSFEEMLPEQSFIRCHRSYIVSLQHVSGFTSTSIDVGNTEIPIGRNYHQQVFKSLKYKPQNSDWK
jgi:DNA-binding LytR/AlgR family response regulator